MSIEIKPGLKFTSKHFTMTAEILEVIQDKNTVRVLLTPKEGASWVENNWDLQHTIWGFDRGEYQEIKKPVKQRYWQDPDNLGGTGHGDISYSDADPGL